MGSDPVQLPLRSERALQHEAMKKVERNAVAAFEVTVDSLLRAVAIRLPQQQLESRARRCEESLEYLRQVRLRLVGMVVEQEQERRELESVKGMGL